MRDMYQQVTDRIVAELQKDAAPWRKPWRILGAGAGYPFPANAVKGRPYSGINVLILWMEETAGLPRYLTYNQASQAGNVR
jgi:antirestriction protein ArdC